MKVKFIRFYFFFPKLIIFLTFIAYSSLLECERDKPILKDNNCVSTYCDESQFNSGECIINNSIIKKRWINNIIKIENTNGELSFAFDKEQGNFLFATSSSNNEEIIFYGMRIPNGDFSYSYPYENNGKFESLIKKKIEHKLANQEMWFIEYTNKKRIFLVGSDNSYAEIIDLGKDSNKIEILSLAELYKQNKVIKGISSLLYLHGNFLNLIALTSSIDNNNNTIFFNLSLYKFLKSTYTIKHHLEEEFVKGKYLSCFNSEKSYIMSCFYLDINNNFTISLYEDSYPTSSTISYFSFKSSTAVGKGYEIEENKYYFMKAASSEGVMKNFGFYAFYSGDNNDIPTFLYKNIDDGNLSDKYDDFPVIYLYDYSFNNDIKFNDILSLQEDHLVFISSLKNREVLIIAYMVFYQSSDSSSKTQFLVRYYSIPLKEYYSIKIFHGLKAIFVPDKGDAFFPPLILAIDFSLYDSSQNSENDISNAGLININYPNINNRKIDFIEIAFKTNKKYILFNLTENFSIDNNLFGFNPSNIDFSEIPLIYEDDNIIYSFEDESMNIFDFFYDFDIGLIKVDLTDYNFEDISIFEDYPAFIYSIILSPPNSSEEFNLYCDKINETYGDKDEDSSIPTKRIFSMYSNYYIEVKEELTIDCKDNCTLCLRNDKNYCIVCEDKFTIIYDKDYKYGKKICQEINDVNTTEELFISTDSDTYAEKSKISSDTNLIDKISNEQNISDISDSTNNYNNNEDTDKLYNKSDKLNNNESETITNEILKSDFMTNIYYTEEFYKENEKLSDINKDKISNEKEILNEEEKENEDKNKISYEDEMTNEKENEINNENEITNEDEIINLDEITNKGEFINEDELINENEITNEDELTNKNEITNENEILNEEEIINKDEDENNNENEKSNENDLIKEDEIINEDEIIHENEIKNENEITNEDKLINEDELINEEELFNEDKIFNEEEIVNENELFNEEEIFDEDKIFNEEEIFDEDEIFNEEEIVNKSELIKEDKITNENENSKYSDSIIANKIIETDKLSHENIIITNDIRLSTISDLFISDILSNVIELLFDDFLNNKYKDINISDEQIQKLYEEIKDYILKKYDGNNTIINTNNVKVQISKIDDQKFTEELSNIDLGECGEILKNKYCKNENDSLIMLKFDIRPENETSTYVQYEIYDPVSKIFLELEECSDSNVIINVPIELNSDMEGLYKWLLEYGYNLFDSKDLFYNDICAAFTTQSGTDILLYDRRMDIYQSTVNISLCQDGCDFQSYDIETKKAKCDCSIQTSSINTDTDELTFNKNEMIDEFYETLDNSNFRVLKCYKLVFIWKIFVKNIGSIFMAILIILYGILVIIHLIKNTRKINRLIQAIIKTKYFDNKNVSLNQSKNSIKKRKKSENHNENIFKKVTFKKKKKRKKSKEKKEIEEIKELKEIKLKKKKKKSINKKNSKSLFVNTLNINHNIIYKINSKNAPPKRRLIKKRKLDINFGNSQDSKNTTLKMSSNNNNNTFVSSNSVRLNLNERSNILRKTNNKLSIDINSKDKENIDIYTKKTKKRNTIHKRSTKFGSPKKEKDHKKKFDFKIFNLMSSKTKTNTKANENYINTEIKKETAMKKLTDQELNTLEYEKAVEIDKRTYCQYYISLLKKKHLILFTFLPANDYNLMSLKLSLFLVSFSLYLTINGFFFNDETMHKIYIDSGIYNVLYQIPQILYSSIISSFINMLLKNLSLSETDILKIKHEQSIKSTIKKSKKTEKCIKIKFIVFFIISLMLIIFFWYFISCFCAVYNNTQVILFKDTLISFGLSMTYPLAINLLPGLFRIPSLRAKNKDKKCLYSFAQVLSLI